MHEFKPSHQSSEKIAPESFAGTSAAQALVLAKEHLDESDVLTYIEPYLAGTPLATIAAGLGESEERVWRDIGRLESILSQARLNTARKSYGHTISILELLNRAEANQERS